MFCYLSRPLGSLAGSTHCTTARFFDASVVRYPSSYSYPGTYATRSLTPVQGYAAGTTMFSTIDISSHIISFSKYAGGVLGPNGLIYFVPRNAWNIGVLNPSSSSFSTINFFRPVEDYAAHLASTLQVKYVGGVLGPNGLIYFVPSNADNIGVLDPSSSSFSTIDISNTISTDFKYAGGVLGPNGRIYFVPRNADNIGVLNPSSSTFTTIDISNTISSDLKYTGGVLGPNGLIYFVPYSSIGIGVLNPSSSTFTNIGASLDCNTNGCYNGGVLGPNGLIYFVPYYVHNVGKLHLGNTQPAVSWQHAVAGSTEEWSSLLSPHFNKF